MDKAELKRTLHEQFVPFDMAVQNKLEYLQSDDVFNVNDYAAYNDNSAGDDSLENAFGSMYVAPTPPVYQAPAPEEVKRMQEAPQPTYAGNSAPTQSSISEHKQNIAAKIAALRGISMPGDYLRNMK